MSAHQAQQRKSVLIMAGGPGGHIFPALALAQTLQQQTWQVHWLGSASGMEGRMIPPTGIPFVHIDFSGVRGKGWRTALAAPWRLLRALSQGVRILRRLSPRVVIGFGGYISLPVGLLARPMGSTLFIHEQNSVAGSANKVLARLAQRTFTTFAAVLLRAEHVGTPLRSAFTQQPMPEQRFAGRNGPLHLLVLGGSLGAKAINETLPQALALLPEKQRPVVLHQSGEKHLGTLQENYLQAGIAANTTAFIQDTATAIGAADVVICRAGASTVSEIAAVGAAALFVPFPYATDKHQDGNASYLSTKDAAWQMAQDTCTPQALAEWLSTLDRTILLQTAIRARALAMPKAAEIMAQACARVAGLDSGTTKPQAESAQARKVQARK